MNELFNNSIFFFLCNIYLFGSYSDNLLNNKEIAILLITDLCLSKGIYYKLKEVNQ